MDLKHAEKQLINRCLIHINVGDNGDIALHSGINDKAFACNRGDLGHELPDIGIL